MNWTVIAIIQHPHMVLQLSKMLFPSLICYVLHHQKHWWKPSCPFLSKNKCFFLIKKGKKTALRSILVKLTLWSVNSNNWIELLKHCNEHAPLFLAALWLWCLTFSELWQPAFCHSWCLSAVDLLWIQQQHCCGHCTQLPFLLSCTIRRICWSCGRWYTQQWNMLNNPIYQHTRDCDQKVLFFLLKQAVELILHHPQKQQRLDPTPEIIMIHMRTRFNAWLVWRFVGTALFSALLTVGIVEQAFTAQCISLNLIKTHNSSNASFY